MVFVADKKNSSYDDKHIGIEGWKIEKFDVAEDTRTYSSNYGDPDITEKAVYSTFTASVQMQRKGWGLFFKLFTGLYVSFIIALLSFFMGAENAERFGLLVGSLFAAVANKYIVDSILPETNDYALVDKIHVICFIYILISLIMTVLAYRLFVAEKVVLAKKIDFFAFWIMLISFTTINIILISAVL